MKLISLNIEGNKHFDKFIPFLKIEDPDVVCLQEVVDIDIPFLENALEMKSIYAPMCYDLITHNGGLSGIAIFSKLPLVNTQKQYYVGAEDKVTTLPANIELSTLHEYVQNVLLSAQVVLDGEKYCIATTHGTWTPKGESTDYQLCDFERMTEILDGLGEFILCGDLNAPRGNETFSRLAAKYKDNIPEEYKTSLDQNLHRVKGLQLMVDGLFTTPKYKASNVRLVDGVSDHMAIVAEIVDNK